MAGSYQAGPSGGESSPSYNLLAPAIISKYPQLNSTTDPCNHLACTCGFCSQRPPSGADPSLLQGVVVFPSPEPYQAPVPVPLYAASPQPPPNRQPETPNSYIMTIPRKYYPQVPSPNTCQEPYTTPTQNVFYSPHPQPQLPPPPPPPPARFATPRQFFYTRKHPFLAACPAAFYFPSTQALSFNQHSVYTHPTQPCSNQPSVYTPPPQPPYFNEPAPLPQPCPNQPAALFPSGPNISQGTLSSPSASLAPLSSPQEPLVTYTLRTLETPEVMPESNLDAENKDCSVPTPPVLV